MTQGDEIKAEVVGADLDSRGSVREMLRIALPMVVSSACHTCMTFVDRWFLSRVGPLHMSAAMGGGIASFMCQTFFVGLIGYTTAIVAQYLGAGKRDRCPLALTQAMLVAWVGYPIILLLSLLVRRMFDVSGLPAGQLGLQKEYFSILIYGSILMMMHGSLASYFSGIGRTRVVMLSALVATVANVVANYALIYGEWGFPELGIRGAAYGTLIGSFLGLMVLVGMYLGRTNRLQFAVGKSLRFSGEVMKKLLRFGYPAGLEMFLNLMAFTTMVTLFHSDSEITSTAVTIVFNWDLVSFMPLVGIQIGVTSLVGRYMGAGRPDIAHRATMSGLRTGVIYAALVFVGFVFFPEVLVNMFRPGNPETFRMAVVMVRLASLYVLTDVAIIVFSGALRGAGDTFWAMCFSVGAHWIMLSAVIMVLHVLKLSPELAWGMMVTTFMIFSMFVYLRYRGGKWRNRRVVPDPVEVIATDHDQDFHAMTDI